MQEEKPDPLLTFESSSGLKKESKSNHDEKWNSAMFPSEHTDRSSNETDSAVETTGLTWHQTKAEFELVAHNSTQDYFTYQESLSIYTFLLDEIRSQNPKRLGRVAKRRVEISDGKLWARYKKSYRGRREIGAYRGHFRAMSGKIHDFPGLSESEKLDLYYALAIKVPKNFRQKLIDLYDVEFDDKGVITASSTITHWDVVHSDSDRDDDDENDLLHRKRKIKWLRFSEREDGVLWEYLLNYVNEHGQKPPVVTKKFWEEFKEKYEGQATTWERVPETYRGRYFKFLAPNLHLMPFDIETKAALFQTMEIPVHKDFRKELIEATGVTIDAEGLVTAYEKRPSSLVLQSRHYESVIGISSANRVSILRNPHTCDQDTVPYTEEEEKQIWEFMRKKMIGPKGKPIRIRQKLTGMILWREFQSAVKTKRFTRSLNQHFNEEMIRNILSTDYDFKTQLELLFSLDVPLEDDEVNYIRQKTYTLHLNTKGAIRYVAGNGFIIGKSLETPLKISKKLLKDMMHRGEIQSSERKAFGGGMPEHQKEEKVRMENFGVKEYKTPTAIELQRSPSKIIREIKKSVHDKRSALLMPVEPEIGEEELQKWETAPPIANTGNSAKFPYLPYTLRPKHQKSQISCLNMEGTQNKRGRKPIHDHYTTVCPPEKTPIYVDTKPENFLNFDVLDDVKSDPHKESKNIERLTENAIDVNSKVNDHESISSTKHKDKWDNEKPSRKAPTSSEQMASALKEIEREIQALARTLKSAQTISSENCKRLISKKNICITKYLHEKTQKALFDESTTS